MAFSVETSVNVQLFSRPSYFYSQYDAKGLWRQIRKKFPGVYSDYTKAVTKLWLLSVGHLLQASSDIHTTTLKLNSTKVHLLAFRDRNKDICICEWSGIFEWRDGLHSSQSEDWLLGRGAFSVVHKIVSIAHGTSFALKIPKEGKRAMHELDLEEVQRRNIDGIIGRHNLRLKECSICYGKLMVNSRELTMGSITKRYDSDAGDLFYNEITEPHRLWLLKELLALTETLAILASHGFFMCDIKAANILLHARMLFLSDFGSVVHATTSWDGSSYNHSVGSYAFDHTTTIDIEALHKAHNMGTISFQEQLERKDVFALGIVFYRLFCRGRFPYSKDIEKKCLIASDLEPAKYDFIKQLLGSNITNLLVSMIHKDTALRPTFKAVAERLSSAIQDIKEHPENYLLQLPIDKENPLQQLNVATEGSYEDNL